MNNNTNNYLEFVTGRFDGTGGEAGDRGGCVFGQSLLW